MKEFDQLCKEFEALDAASYATILVERSARLLPVLAAVVGDGLSGAELLAVFALGAIAADGRVTEEEFAVSYPFFRLFFGENADYDHCRSLALGESRRLKKIVNKMVDVLGDISDELKTDAIMVCMVICAVDGKISPKEKRWIKQLIR